MNRPNDLPDLPDLDLQAPVQSERAVAPEPHSDLSAFANGVDQLMSVLPIGLLAWMHDWTLEFLRDPRTAVAWAAAQALLAASYAASGRTPGATLCGIWLADEQGRRASFARGFLLRHTTLVLCTPVAPLGWLVVRGLWRRSSYSLPDLVAGTHVVLIEPPAATQSTPPSPPPTAPKV